MADGDFATLISRNGDTNEISNPIYVQLSDGTDVINIDANGNLGVILAANDGVDIGDVDVTSVIPGTGATNLGKAEDTQHTSGDVGVMILGVRQDTQVDFGEDGDYVPLSIDTDGAVRVSGNFTVSEVDDSAGFNIGVDSVSPCGFLADEVTPDNVDEGDIGLARMTLDRKILTVITDANTDANRMAIDASGLVQVDLADHAITNANALPVSKDNSPNSATNPIYVQTVDVGTSTSEVHDYNTAVAVGAGSTSNHDYTISNNTFLLKSIIFASSGAGKFEVQVGPVASLTTKAVGFVPRRGGMEQITFNPPIEVPSTSTGTIRVIRTNRQGAAQDVYSTIIGNDTL